MNYDLIYDGSAAKKQMRDAFHETLVEFMNEDETVFEIEADLAGAARNDGLTREFPKRALNTGIQEANMVGMCAGLSLAGKKPYCHTFAPFMSRRVMDQLFMMIAYNHLEIHAWGSDCGICSRSNGGTHAGNEDVACWRSLAGSVVLEPCDPAQLADLFRKTKGLKAPVYIRSDRGAANAIYADGCNFEVGKGAVLRDGRDVTLIAAGIEVEEALKAAELLSAEGVSARVVDMYSIKPLDVELVKRCARETGAIVTAENHNINGGLGDAVASASALTCPVPIEKVAIDERFGQVGDLDFLKKEYALDAGTIVRKAKAAMARK